jgi:hypothetical protein
LVNDFTKRKGAKMASKLMIVKQSRPSVDVPFYTQPVDTKAALKLIPIPMVSGERNIDGGLKKIRTLFFANPAAFTAWEANQMIQDSIAARTAYNLANGITQETHVVDMPNYNPFAAPKV